MLIENSSLEMDSGSNSQRLKYSRDLLIKIGNQNVSVTSVPEQFLELAKAVKGTGSPTRQMGVPKGIVPPLSRGNSRGELYGGSIRNSSASNGIGGFSLFGPLVVPPPAPESREPKMVIKTQEKLLHTDPNAWKPGRLKKQTKEEKQKSEEELVIEGIVKDTRGILNKLTPENFDRLMEKFMALPLEDKEERIEAVINVLFEKAIDESAFSTAYAKMVDTVCRRSPQTASVFRKQILDKCQREFQRSDTDEDKASQLLTKINETGNTEEKQRLEGDLEDLKFSMRRRALGNVRFIGELYKLQMLTAKIMVSCVKLLLGNPDDEKLECLCKLLATVGHMLDEQLKEIEVRAKQKNVTGPEEKLMDKFFATLDKLSHDKKFSSRIRFAIMDAVELRQNNWKPRRQAAGPKTIGEVHRDALLQELEEKQKLQCLPPPSPEINWGGGKREPSMNAPISHVPKKSDWTTVQNKAARFQKKPVVEQSGIQSFAPPTGPMFGAR